VKIVRFSTFTTQQQTSAKAKRIFDVFTMVHHRHIQLVISNLKFIISHYLAAQKSGFWTDAEITATGP